jgi:predicted dehydrogenase
MSGLTRRDFIRSSVAVGAGLALATPFAKARGANDAVRLAVIGVGERGGAHLKEFGRIDGVRIVAVCDADQNRVNQHVDELKKQGITVDGYTDMRRVFDRKDIDAISAATCNHWHALTTIWACQTGKDVYVEKPVSHNVWEGRKMVEAARKYNRIVQAGMQKRSSDAHAKAFQWIKDGNLGAVKCARGLCYKSRYGSERGIVPAVNGPVPIPPGVDYNLWCGPADMAPLNRKMLHYVWHWFWNTGNGDLGNQGVHEVDLCSWGLGDPGLPDRVISIGGRFAFNDIGETANTQIIYCDYQPAPLIFEVRGLPRKKGENIMDNYKSTGIGIVMECEKGYWSAGDAGGWVYHNDGTRSETRFAGGGGGGHMANFITAVRSRKVADLNGDIEKGHISSALCHMANTSYRLGRRASVNEIKTAIADTPLLAEAFDRMVEHLKANEVDCEKEPITLGPWLTMDPQKEVWTGDSGDPANLYLKRNYREPFIVPEQV